MGNERSNILPKSSQARKKPPPPPPPHLIVAFFVCMISSGNPARFIGLKYPVTTYLRSEESYVASRVETRKLRANCFTKKPSCVSVKFITETATWLAPAVFRRRRLINSLFPCWRRLPHLSTRPPCTPILDWIFLVQLSFLVSFLQRRSEGNCLLPEAGTKH